MTSIEPDRNASIQEGNAEQRMIDEVCARLEEVVIDTPETFVWATERVKAIKQAADAWDNRRLARVGPLTNVVRLINSDYRPATVGYERAERILKTKIAAYVEAQQARRVAAAIERHAVPMPALETVAGVAVRTKRRWTVTDADKVPRQFCSPDPAKIDTFLRDGGLEAIPGIRFYDESQVIVHKDK